MTQEELDALMDGGFEDEELATMDEDGVEKVEESTEEEVVDIDECLEDTLPPKATEDNKIVNQLDHVTQDSEKKATEIFDRLDGISEYISTVEDESNSVISLLEENSSLFEKLSNHFEEIETFKTFYERNKDAISTMEDVIEKSQLSSDEILTIMDTMQYQDIHRQKIERVVNVMRSLLRYMNTLFGSDIKDEERVSSAQHIIGDQDSGEVVSAEDIEALLESFGKK